MSVIVLYSIREQLSHIMHTLNHPHNQFMTDFFLAYTAVLWVSSFSELPFVPVGLSGSVTHRETFTGGEGA